MRIPSRVAPRATFALGLAAVFALALAPPAPAAVPPEKVLPGGTTLALIKIRDAKGFREALGRSQVGQLFNDPAVRPLRDDLSAKLEQGGQKLKDRIGVTIPELLNLPQGPTWAALLVKDDPKIPVALILTADAGTNADAMAEVMTKATKQAEDNGGKLSVEQFHDLTLTVIRSPKDEDKEAPPLAWARNGGVFHIGSDVDALKDVLAHSDGREDSLAEVESFQMVERKLGEETHASYFLDIAKSFQLGMKVAAAAQGGQAGQFEGFLKLLGLDGLKALGGSLAFNAGEYDQVTKTVLLAPGEPAGLLKAFRLPPVDLKPEPWVPASVASYEAVSWDLDNAYNAINDLANSVNPGILDNLLKSLVPPGGGEPLNIKKDLIAAMGSRFTVIGDFKKPINEDSQRVLFSIALRDPKAFQTTLSRLLAMAKTKPKTREFLGTTIMDVEFDRPNPPGANLQGGAKGKLSLAVARGNMFVASEPSLVEQVIRPGGPALADSPAFQTVAKNFPEQASLLSYQRSEEQARLLYDLVKSGKFQKAIQGANMGNGGNDRAAEFLDPDKLPDFSIIAKYLSPAGAFGLPDDEGMTITRFTLRKAVP